MGGYRRVDEEAGAWADTVIDRARESGWYWHGARLYDPFGNCRFELAGQYLRWFGYGSWSSVRLGKRHAARVRAIIPAWPPVFVNGERQ